MYFWKVDKLVEDFKADKVSQKEEFKYLLAFIILSLLVADKYLYSDELYSSYTTNDLIYSMSGFVISIWGIYFCYKINTLGDNENFIARMICIILPTTVRIVALFMPVYFLLSILYAGLIEYAGLVESGSDSALYETTIFDIVILSIIEIIYYLYLGKKMKAVSS